MTNFVDYPAPGAHRVTAAELNAAFATKIEVNSYAAPTTVVGPISNTNPTFPTRSAFCLQGTKASTEQHSSDWMAVIGIYSETGGPTQTDSKVSEDVGLYVGAMQGSGSGRNPGAMWSMNTDIVRGAIPGGPNSLNGQPGSGQIGPAGGVPLASSTIGYELDFSNWDRDCPPGGAFTVGMFINTNSVFASLAGIFYGAEAGQSVPSWHNGIYFQGPINGGPRTVQDNTIYDVSGSDVGYHLAGVHSIAAFYDESTGAQSIFMGGLKTVGDIVSVSNSPTALTLSGVRTVAGIYENSTGPTAIQTNGNHTAQMISITGNAPAAINATGVYPLAAFTSTQATTPIALEAAPGQKITLNGIFNGMNYSTTNGRVYFTNNANVIVASLDDAGNLRLAGTVTQSTTP